VLLRGSEHTIAIEPPAEREREPMHAPGVARISRERPQTVLGLGRGLQQIDLGGTPGAEHVEHVAGIAKPPSLGADRASHFDAGFEDVTTGTAGRCVTRRRVQLFARPARLPVPAAASHDQRRHVLGARSEPVRPFASAAAPLSGADFQEQRVAHDAVPFDFPNAAPRV